MSDDHDSALLLEATGVHKHYGGVHALRGVALSVRPGEVHALVGENGAGKTTMINILAGAVRRDAGRINFAGRDIDFHAPAQAQTAGITVIHQELATLPTLSVAENIFMGRMPARAGWLDRGAMHHGARELLAQVGLDVDPRTPARNLSLSQQQLVEIARALSADTKLLVMDEPSASLTDHETERLLELVRSLRGRGVAVLYVSHRMAEVLAVSDRVTVYRDGFYVATEETAATTASAVVGLMVGREISHVATSETRRIGDTVLEVRGLTSRPRDARDRSTALRDVSLTVRRGEILGLAGLVGAGRSEVGRAIFGADQLEAGTILLEGSSLRLRSPADAIRSGVAMVPEDRKRLALFSDKPVRWNISMARLPALSRVGIIGRASERKLTSEYVEKLRIRTPGLETPVRALSGGNQQKTVLARWLAMRPKLLILDEPTHGVDVAAKAEVYALIRALADDGVAILFISSELSEILDLSDRIVVMRMGRVVAALDRRDADEHLVMLHATGTSLPPS